MANIINEIGIENCFSILIIINLILLIGFIITILKTEKLKKKYEKYILWNHNHTCGMSHRI